MLLQEVKPNYMESDFLNSFLNRPQSFFSPRAPQKFQRFIQKFGTHYVKAAKFGGSFKVIKTRKITSTADISDFRKEIQKEMNKIVGNTVIQARSAKAENTQSHSGSNKKRTIHVSSSIAATPKVLIILLNP